MINGSDVGTTADRIIMLERAALDRWGKGDPCGLLTAARWFLEGDPLALVVHSPLCVSEHVS